MVEKLIERTTFGVNAFGGNTFHAGMSAQLRNAAWDFDSRAAGAATSAVLTTLATNVRYMGDYGADTLARSAVLKLAEIIQPKESYRDEPVGSPEASSYHIALRAFHDTFVGVFRDVAEVRGDFKNPVTKTERTLSDGAILTTEVLGQIMFGKEFADKLLDLMKQHSDSLNATNPQTVAFKEISDSIDSVKKTLDFDLKNSSRQEMLRGERTGQ